MPLASSGPIETKKLLYGYYMVRAAQYLTIFRTRLVIVTVLYYF